MTRIEFFVRVANGTKALDVVQRGKYITGRWGSIPGEADAEPADRLQWGQHTAPKEG